MGTLGMYKATDILAKTTIGPRVKGSYYVVNRVLYSYDYATSVYEKKKYAALTQNIEIHHYSISPNSRDNSLFKRLLIEKKRGPITTTYFPHYFSF
jgi:hypothetical protein